VVAISSPPASQRWSTLSFVSTLYLCPILDLLLVEVPSSWRWELRLGLQEALVNASKHGNRLDPTKKVSVRFARCGDLLWWVIADQGPGFAFPCDCNDAPSAHPKQSGECGRGLYILYQVFDQVRWHQGGREVHLCKQVQKHHPRVY